MKDKAGHSNWGEGLDAPPKAKSTAKLFPKADEATLAWAMEMAIHPITGTINCLALNTKGEMSGVTTTSGLGWKIAGRVGYSPIIGAGLYVEPEVGGAGSTGRGEENIRVAGGAPMPIVESCLARRRRPRTRSRRICLKRISRSSITIASGCRRSGLISCPAQRRRVYRRYIVGCLRSRARAIIRRQRWWRDAPGTLLRLAAAGVISIHCRRALHIRCDVLVRGEPYPRLGLHIDDQLVEP